MLDDVQDEFEQRCEDIDMLLLHVQKISNDKESQALVHILFSSLDLMIYNQIEATASSCFEAIYDHIDDQGILYDELTPNFQKKILGDILSTYDLGNTLHKKINAKKISQVISRISFKGDKLFSGNVDKRKLQEISKKYDLNFTTPAYANNGGDLVTIKESRNNLTHGSISFSRHGALSTYNDVEKRATNIRVFMKSFISQTEDYLINKRYLEHEDAAVN